MLKPILRKTRKIGIDAQGQGATRFMKRIILILGLSLFPTMTLLAQDTTEAEQAPASSIDETETGTGDENKRERLPFDHSETGFELIGAHSFVPCESCHHGGQFNGTPRECVFCHSLNGLVNATPKTVDHVTTTNQCENCHRETVWDDVLRFDHSQALGNCTACHNGVLAEGKSSNHIASVADCVDCHTDFAWLPAFFTHDGITAGCFLCHNGFNQPGKNIGHVESDNICENCHVVTAWVPAVFSFSVDGPTGWPNVMQYDKQK